MVGRGGQRQVQRWLTSFLGTIQSTKQKSWRPSSSFNQLHPNIKRGGQIHKKLDSHIPSNLTLQPNAP
jgi:hypothetical protein